MSEHLTPSLQYIPLSDAEDDTDTVRRCLRKFGRQLQQQGDIPPDVSEIEINAEMETYVPQIVRALHRSPLYPHLKEKGRRHLEQHIEHLLAVIL